MPFGYLITIGIIGVCTLAALIPPPGYGRLGRLSYFLADIINEVPHIAALWLVLSAALALSEGDLTGRVGAVLLALTALILLGLIVLLRRCLLARSVIAEVVGDQGSSDSPPRWTWLRPLLFPIPLRPRSVMRIGGLRYGPHRRQRLDVLRHRNRDLTGPVLVYLHGGGYSSGGNRREGRALLHHLAARGWVCISANYRLRPEADFTYHLDDARAVLRWARDNGAAHGGDPSRIVMSGSSAGAHMTSLIALEHGEDTGDPPLHEQPTPRITAALCLYGYYGRYYGRGDDEYPVSTPLGLDPSAAPPILIVHGDHDSWTPVQTARDLSAHVASGSRQPTWYAEFPGGQHGLDVLFAWRFAATVHGVDEFLEHIGIESPLPSRPNGSDARTAASPPSATTHHLDRGAGS